MNAATASDIELDRGPHGGGPERLCAATRTVRPVEDLIRFVIGPDGAAVPDIKRKLPGRGVWVTATQAALEDAIKRRAFTRGFKRDVRLPADLPARTGHLLEHAMLDALAIVHKAGLAVTGFGAVEDALARTAMGKTKVVALLHASEAAANGVDKLDAAARRRSPETASIRIVRSLSGTQLDLALGRPNVVHAALLAGPASDTFLARFQRLERFRSGDVGKQPGNVRTEVEPDLPIGIERE